MMDGKIFDGIATLMQIGIYALLYGIPVGGTTILTLLAGAFVGYGWWMVVPISIACAISAVLDKKLLH